MGNGGVVASISADENGTLLDWADRHAIDCRSLYPVDPKQYVATVQIEQAVVNAMIDTGAHGTIIDKATTTAMKLDVTPAEAKGGFGCYSSPGYPPRPYAGIVHGPVALRFGPEIVLQVPFIRIIESNKPQVLLGVDLLCGGRDRSRWNYKGCYVDTTEDGQAKGYLLFKLGSRAARCELVHAPTIAHKNATVVAATEVKSLGKPTTTPT